MHIRSIMTIVLVGACAAPAWADEGPPPPDNAKALSSIIAQVEQRPDFRYVDEVDLKHGFYKVEYYTKDGVEHKLYIDPVTGKPR